MPTTTLTQLVNNIHSCSANVGFNTFKFGKLAHINFDHNIEYDLLNLEYPRSRIYDVNTALQVFTCIITAARPLSKSNVTGVGITDNVHLIMTALENRIWNLLSCVGAGSNCQDVIPKDTIEIHRDKGTYNDNLVTLTCSFNIEVFSACFEIDCNNPVPPVVPDSWNCIKTNLYAPDAPEDVIAQMIIDGTAYSYSCIDPGDGTGTYPTLSDCQGKCGGKDGKGKGDGEPGGDGADL